MIVCFVFAEHRKDEGGFGEQEQESGNETEATRGSVQIQGTRVHGKNLSCQRNQPDKPCWGWSGVKQQTVHWFPASPSFMKPQVGLGKAMVAGL